MRIGRRCAFNLSKLLDPHTISKGKGVLYQGAQIGNPLQV